MEMELKKSRNYQLDVLRVLACYLVIHQHASEFFYIGEGGTIVTGENTFWVGIITSVARISVPLFVMISGYLLLPMQGTVSAFFRKRFTRILFPFVAWCVAYAFYRMFRNDGTWSGLLTDVLHIPVNFGVEVGHLWYIYMLMGLYLIVPVLSPWLSACSKRELQGYLGLWGLTTLLPYVHLVFPALLGECFWNPTPAFYYLNGFAGYLVLGFYLKKYDVPSVGLSLIFVLSGYAVTAAVFCSRIYTSAMVAELELSWGFCTANVALLTLGVFALVMHCPDRKCGWLQDVSVKSYGMYLSHIMLLNLVYEQLASWLPDARVAVPVIALVTFVCVYVLVKLLSYLPYSKYWLG